MSNRAKDPSAYKKELYLYPTKFSALSSKEPRYLNTIYFKQHESHIMYALFVRVEQILIHYFHDSRLNTVLPLNSLQQRKKEYLFVKIIIIINLSCLITKFKYSLLVMNALNNANVIVSFYFFTIYLFFFC